MATTVTTLSSNLKAMDQEVHIINWVGTEATATITTGLSVIYAASVCDAFGDNAGHTEQDLGLVELNSAVALGTDGSLTVAAGSLPVTRFKTVAAATLAAQQTCVILWGKS
ncbi:MAG TPA: hypothetical protein DHW20_01895 [Gemmatimonadetes bacterium]|nr:hypothetical protein [Gemmatimonadota bacterium]|tara:strand:- start:47 stop:379 length:333 start_codon:yes stop_codon:yes gene_type:complete